MPRVAQNDRLRGFPVRVLVPARAILQLPDCRKRVKPEVVVRLLLRGQGVSDLRSRTVEITSSIGKRKATVRNLFEGPRDCLLKEDAAVKPSRHVLNTRHIGCNKLLSGIE